MFAVALIGFVAYSGSLSGEFVWDDASSVLLHENVKDPSKLFQLFREDQHAFGRGQGNFYRPLLSVSFMVDYMIAHTPADPVLPPSIRPPSLSSFPFHVTSTLWHIAAALFLFALMTRLGATSTVRAIAVAAYLLHPLHTEAVAYISGRADSMAAAFLFAGLALSLDDPRSRRRGWRILLASCYFVFGLLSKESALIYPALLFVCICLTARDQGEGAASFSARLLPFYFSLPIAAVYVGLRATVLNFAPDSSSVQSSFGERIVESGQAFALYVGLIFAPLNLHMERTLAGATSLTAALGFLFVLAALALLVYAHKRCKPGVALGLGWFLVTWLPISGLFPLNAPMAEHWMYVPLAGFLWALASLMFDPALPGPLRKVFVAAAAIWCVWLLSLTAARNADWRDNESIYTATLRENPGSLRVHHNLAVTYHDILDNPIGAQREYRRLLSIYESALEADPVGAASLEASAIESKLLLAQLYVGSEDLPEASGLFAQVIQQSQTENRKRYLVEALFGLGRVRMAMGDEAGAVQQFSALLDIEPELLGAILRMRVEGPGVGEL